MDTTKDGGAAFPGGAISTQGFPVQKGMSLRDWFAGQALAGLLASGASLNNADDAAEQAYRTADSLLRARSKE